MGLWESIRLFFTSPANRRKQRFREPPLPPPEQGRDLDELGRRLGMSAEKLAAFAPAYRQFTIPKRTGGTRTITAPDQPTKVLQRRILRRLLSRLPAHPAAMGFEKGQSIVTHALGHAVRAVVVRMDIRDF